MTRAERHHRTSVSRFAGTVFLFGSGGIASPPSLGGLNLHSSCVIYMHVAICSPALPLHPILNVPGAQRGFLLNHHPPLQAWNQSIIHVYLQCEFLYVKLQLINLFL